MRRRMENKLRAIVCEYSFKAFSVAHGSYFHSKVKLVAVFTYKLLLNIVCVVFVNIKDNKLLGLAF